MKLAHPELTRVFDSECGEVNTLIIENPMFMHSFLTDLTNQLNGTDGQIIVSEDDKPLNISKSVELLDSFFPFDINRKALITKISSILEKEAISADHYEDTCNVLSHIEKYLFDLSFNCSADIIFTKISAPMLIRGAGIEIRSEASGLAESILDYMELVREFDRDKLFIMLNLRSFISDSDTNFLLRSVLSKGLHMLMIESKAGDYLQSERRWIVDSDLCEIG